MNYFLVKSEPSAYSWEQFAKDGKARWDGVRNYAARNHLRAMKKNDEVLFYHSNEGMEIVGIAKVANEAYRDPTAGDDDRWSCVDLVPLRKLKKAVPFTSIKKEHALKNLPLVRIPRLSVMPVTKEELAAILSMSE
ncbi:MAG: EVE domain-containing protein [Bacteroidetes bacterium]|nr:EVE domain-containing protein [Bacteroidota bacterium]